MAVVFRAADEEGPIAARYEGPAGGRSYVSEHAADLSARYGNVAPVATVATIQRKLLVLERPGRGQAVWRTGAQSRRPHAVRWGRARLCPACWLQTS